MYRLDTGDKENSEITNSIKGNFTAARSSIIYTCPQYSRVGQSRLLLEIRTQVDVTREIN